MRIEDLKQNIISKNVGDSLIIFIIKDNDFIPNQYINEIARIKNKEILYVSSADSLKKSLFEEDDVIKVLRQDKILSIDNFLLKEKNIYIICKEIDLDLDCIVKVPELEESNIKDYAFSILKGVPSESIISFVKNCNFNIFKLDNELQKISIFEDSIRSFIFNSMIEENSFSESDKNISYDLVNCIAKKDLVGIRNLLKKDLSLIDPIGLTTLLLNQFRNIIQVQLSNYSSPESVGLKPNQYWAIKHLCGIYSKEQLVKIFMFLSSIDKKLKSSELSSTFILDYIVVNILNV